MPILFAVFFLSGASALIYQILWIRLFGLVFGGTTVSMSVVVAAFMGGLALGSRFFGQFAARVSNRVRLYGYLELGLAVLGIGVFWGIRNLSGLVYSLPIGVNANSFAGVTIRLVLSFALLIIPTMIMGGTLPVLLRGITAERKDIIRNTGYLYAFNTLGAMVGAFCAGFFLLRYLGVTRSNLVAVCVNFLLGAIALLVSGRFESTPDTVSVSEEKKAGSSRQEKGIPYIVTLTITGFAGLALEMVWLRILLLRFNNTTYLYSIVITTILFGLGLGGLLLPLIVPARCRNERSLGLILAGLGISILAGYILYPLITAYGFSSFSYYNTWIRVSALTFLVFVFLGFLPSFLMGLSLPVGVGLYAHEVKGLSRKVGIIYAFNTMGSLAGSLLSVFILVPSIGMKGTLLLCTALVMAPAFYFISRDRQGSHRMAILTALGIFYGIFFIISANIAIPRIILSRLLESDERIEHVREGASSTVWISAKRLIRRIWIDNLWVSSTSREGTHALLAHYPILFHSGPKKVAGIAFGTGQTFGTCLLYPIEKIDCVEIDPEVIKACEGRFTKENYGILESPRSRIIIDDGRFFLGGTREKYDIVTAEPLQPYTRGTVNLYSLEFYRACKRVLNPGGVVAQWLPVYNSGVRDTWSMIRTFAEAFDYVLLFLNGSDGILLGSDSEMRLKPSNPLPGPVLRDMDRIENGSVYALAGNFVCSREKLLEASRNYPVITDDHPVLEFTAPISHWNEDVTGPIEMCRQFLGLMEPIDPLFTGEVDWDLARRYHEGRRLITEGTIREKENNNEAAYKSYLAAYQTNPQDIRAIKSLYFLLRKVNRLDLLPPQLGALLKSVQQGMPGN
jgi:spermidine synthase